MGRASRLKDDNRGNRWREVIARNECLKLLAEDLRIQEQWQAWVRAQEQRAREGPPDSVHSQADFDRAVAEAVHADINAVAAVLAEMGITRRWCAEVLVTVSFPAMWHNLLHPDDLRDVEGRFELHGVPKGRVPRHGGEDVRDWVRWWYRRTIKDPKDPLHVLVQEYATRENRVTEAHSVVVNGIERAETLLNV